jgi:hypothetical protein
MTAHNPFKQNNNNNKKPNKKNENTKQKEKQTKRKQNKIHGERRGLCYFSGSRDHFALAFDNTCKACMIKVTSTLEYIEVLQLLLLMW